MAPRFALLLLLLLLGCSCRLISAGDPSRSPCYDPLHSLSACSDYIFPNPAESNAPTNECCSRLESVIRNQPLCLCEVVLTDTFFIQNRAVGLPKACNLTTPPVSLCRVAGVPKPTASSSSSGHSIGKTCTLLLLYFVLTIGGVMSFLGVA